MSCIIRRVLLYVAVIALLAVKAAAQQLPNDPALVIGKLDNGLEYIVRQHSVPPGRAVIWVHMHTGSLNETDRQRGIAHYAAIVIKRLHALRSKQRGMAMAIMQFAAAAPELQCKVIEGIVAIGIAGKDCAVEPLRRPGEEAGHIFKLPPGARRLEIISISRAEGSLLG